jgi:hypothetical protein
MHRRRLFRLKTEFVGIINECLAFD